MWIKNSSSSQGSTTKVRTPRKNAIYYRLKLEKEARLRAERKVRALEKRFQRFSSQALRESQETPSMSASPSKQKKVKMYDTLVKNIKNFRSVKSRKKVLQDITSPKQLSAFRVMKQLSIDVALDRRTLANRAAEETKKSALYKERREAIRTFLMRPEYSITLPGKKDTVTIKKVKHQKIQLTEFLDVLHQKFNLEYPAEAVSMSFFASVRRSAPYILPVSCRNTTVCLCEKHQNFALMLKPLRSINIPSMPDTLIREWTPAEVELRTSEMPDSQIVKYQQWRRIDVPYGDNKTAKKLRLVDQSHHKNEFRALLLITNPHH